MAYGTCFTRQEVRSGCQTPATPLVLFKYSNDDTIKNIIGAKNVDRQLEITILESWI